MVIDEPCLTKNLLKMKKNVLILLAVMLLGVPKTFAYDFSAVAPSGQTLYYSINDDGTSVSVVSPYNGGYGYLK